MDERIKSIGAVLEETCERVTLERLHRKYDMSNKDYIDPIEAGRVSVFAIFKNIQNGHITWPENMDKTILSKRS